MPKKVIVIGGGVAGLSAGIYAQMNGYESEILEMHHSPGGQCTAWKRKDYTFDYCLHWLVGSSHGPFHDVWKETGALDESTVLWDPEIYTAMRLSDGSDFIIYSDLDRWEQYLLELAPEDSGAVRTMCNHMRKMEKMQLFDKPYFERNLMDYLGYVTRSAPALRLFFRYGKMSLKDYFDKLKFKSRILKQSLTEIARAMEDFSAFAFLMTLLWFSQKNAGYPIGGSLPFSLRMAERYRSLGGAFRGGQQVEKILVRNNEVYGVRLTDGTEREADIVIGACDLHSLMYHMLDGKYLTKDMERAFARWPLFSPIIQVSFGIDIPVETSYHTCAVFAPGEYIGSTKIKTAYAISSYNHDRQITPEGKCVMKLVVDSPMENWEGMDKADYKAEKERIEQDAIARLEAFYPEVKGHIDVVDVATPLTDIRYTGVWKGAYEGFLPTKDNMTKSLKYTIRGLENFYLAGQWLQPGGGLPPSAISGKWVVKLMTRKDGKDFKSLPSRDGN